MHYKGCYYSKEDNQVPNHCYLTREALQWLAGELLGDGCLQTHSSVSAYFAYGSKYTEYIQYVADTLKGFGIEQAGKINPMVANSIVYHYCSSCYEELFPIWMEWYMYGGKQVPKDLELTPLVCRQWYIGDGGLQTNGCGITLSTCGFPPTDVLWLVMKLNHAGFQATYQPKQNKIGISAHSVQDFLDYIGECPVNCYRYKWEVRQHSKL